MEQVLTVWYERLRTTLFTILYTFLQIFTVRRLTRLQEIEIMSVEAMTYPEVAPLTEDQREDVCLVSGSTYPELAAEIAEVMGTEVDGVDLKQFANSEVYARFLESLRGKRVVAVQSLAAKPDWSVNDGLVEVMLMANAARGASAREVTAVLPYLAYARQDGKAKGRENISLQAILDALAVNGVNRIVTVDPHSRQVQLGFRGPFDQLIAEPLLQEELVGEITSHDADYMVIAPDAGRATIAQHYSSNLSNMTQAQREGRLVGFNIMGKRRLPDGKVVHEAPKGVAGKACIVVDDMIDTAGTLLSATDKLEEAGADRIVVAATHGLFSGEALINIGSSAIKRIIVTDTVPQGRALETLEPERLKVLSIAPLIGAALVEIVTDGSVSKLFQGHKQYS